jgi:hypothetical protein
MFKRLMPIAERVRFSAIALFIQFPSLLDNRRKLL